MPLTFEATEALFRLGHFSRIVSELGALNNGALSVVPEHRLLLAHALFHTGDDRRAEEIVQSEYDSAAPYRIKARCELIRGLLRRREGQFSTALGHFELSLKLSLDCGDHGSAAWAALQRFRYFAETQPSDSLTALLHELRHSVVLASDPHASAYLHDSIALMEASMGRPDEARRHIRVCQSLLRDHPNAWLEQVANINAFFVDFLESRYLSALDHLRAAKALIPFTGERQKELIECNEGHVLLILGQFPFALQRFQRLAKARRGPTVLAAVDGLARTHLATGGLHACEAAIEVFDDITASNCALINAFAGRWNTVTRSKLLLRLRRFEQAQQQISAALAQARALDDRLLIGLLHCLEAEALSAMGRSSDAARSLAQAAIRSPAHAPDHLASYYRSAGEALMHSQHPIGESLLERADAIWRQLGNRCAASELANSLRSRKAFQRSDAVIPEVKREMKVVENLGSACGLAYNARLLGRELLEAIRLLDCSPNSAVIEIGKAAADIVQDDRAVTLTLGVDAENAIVLKCAIPPEPFKAVLLNDVLRIGRAALAFEQVRAQNQSQASLWPADPIEHEAGTVFIADQMRDLLATARRIAGTNVPVLITGETGTGKEVLARLIHAFSPRTKAAFIPFNCTATPRDMLDSQLFGHRRGSFTGATEHFPGVIRAAAAGTLFLDEIGETTLDVQPKLLRFLECSEVHPIGETHPVRVDVRVIAATNTDLETLVADRRFRSDLLYRLNIVRLHIPPLRDRRVEIPALASHYLRRFAQENHKGELRLAEETIEFLLLYRWPGNVRQLANEMRRLAALAEKGAVLMPEHLSPDIAASRRTLPASDRVLDPTEVVVRLDQPLAAGVGHLERAMIQNALRQCEGRLEETAARLGLSRKGLYLKRQRYGLDLLTSVASIDDVA